MEHFLKSKCNFDQLGKQIDNVGGWCSLYIVLMVINLIGYTLYNIRTMMDLKSKGKNDSLKKIYMKTVVNAVISLLSIYFLYSMCKLCRGWTALLIIIVVSCLQLGLIIYIS